MRLLIKTAAYGLLGYVMYELFRGMIDENHENMGRFANSERFDEPVSSPMVETNETDGGSSRQYVGRGVVSY